MATPGELVQTMADVLGVPRPTVFQYDRSLAENGLRSKKGRGRSAATVTARDAANLLIAAVATPVSGFSIKDAARACESYASLPRRTRDARRRELSKTEWPTLPNLPYRHSFGDALSALIESWGRGGGFKASEPRAERIRLKVLLEGPRHGAEIVAFGAHGDASSENVTDTKRLVYGGRSKVDRDPGTRDEAFGDLTLRGSITLVTIQTLGSLLKEGRHA
jgi:hypothetical protein